MVRYLTPVDQLARTITSLRQDHAPDRLWLVDNSPEPLLAAERELLAVEYLWNGKNLGYGQGHNRAIFQPTAAKYHLILNPDIEVHPGTVERLLAFLEENPDVGAVVPRVLNSDGSLQFLNKRQPTVFDLALRFLGRGPLAHLCPARRARYELRDLGYDHSYDLETASGAFLFCRTSTLRSVGGFDPRYFMYFEDFDLCRAMRQAGFRTVYRPDAVVTHLWERGSHKSPSLALAHLASACRYFNKWGWQWW